MRVARAESGRKLPAAPQQPASGSRDDSTEPDSGRGQRGSYKSLGQRLTGPVRWLSDFVAHRTVLSLALLFACGLGLLHRQLWVDQEEFVQQTALQHAEIYSAAITEFRTLYTSEVVNTALQFGLSVTHDYRQRKHAIPLPATLSMELARRLGEHKSGSKTFLYSPFPFPWRQDEGGLRDQFSQDAWVFLSHSPDRPFYRIETYQGSQTLRYATADLMRTDCVNCHNTHPETPKRDWKVGDLRGVLEVDYPLQYAQSLAEERTQHALNVIGPVFLLGLATIGLVRTKHRRWNEVLESRVEQRTQDLNESRKRSLAERNQLRTLIDNLPDHVYFKDSQGRFLVNNRKHAELLQARGLQDPIGKTDLDVFSKEEAEAYYADDQAVMSSGKPLVNQRETVSDGHGNTQQVLTTKVPFRNARGEVAGLVGISRDITKEHQLEESRRVMKMQLHQAQKLESIGQLAAGIAHEINTPTQFVGDNTVFLKRAFTGLMEAMNRGRSLLEEAQEGAVSLETTEQATKAFKKAKVDYLAKQVPRALEQSLEGLERVAKLVGAMKEFSHPSQGQKEAVDLAHTIDTTLTVARNEWKYIAEVVTDFDSSLPPVPCLRDEFNQVILNMVVNAAQAIAAANGNHSNQKGTITIQTRLAGEWAEIRVSDTGTGIPPEIRQKIFDPFFTTREVGKGTGQGLAIARSVVVDKHGGQIDVESEVGKGTTFVMRLPLLENALSEEGKQA